MVHSYMYTARAVGDHDKTLVPIPYGFTQRTAPPTPALSIRIRTYRTVRITVAITQRPIPNDDNDHDNHAHGTEPLRNGRLAGWTRPATCTA